MSAATDTWPPRRGWLRESIDLLRVGLPIVFVNVTLVAMHTTDAWMVARLGDEELAAITPSALFVFMLQSVLCGGLAAVTTLVAQAVGRGGERSTGNYAWQGLYLSPSW